VPVVPSPVVEYFEGRLDPAADDADDLVKAVHRIMTHADERRRLKVRANWVEPRPWEDQGPGKKEQLQTAAATAGGTATEWADDLGVGQVN